MSEWDDTTGDVRSEHVKDGRQWLVDNYDKDHHDLSSALDALCDAWRIIDGLLVLDVAAVTSGNDEDAPGTPSRGGDAGGVRHTPVRRP